MKFDKFITLRLFIFLIAVVVLFLGSRFYNTVQVDDAQLDIGTIAAKLGAEIDSVLVKFNIDIKKVRKKAIPIPNTNLNRIERQVSISSEVDPLHINQALNLMAKKYNGRAIGSENLKENTVTVHIKLENYILETIIFKSRTDGKYAKRKK